MVTWFISSNLPSSATATHSILFIKFKKSNTMKKFTVEMTISKKFQPKETVDVAVVTAKSQKAAVDAVKFYAKSGINPVDAEVNLLVDNLYWNNHFSAYQKG